MNCQHYWERTRSLSFSSLKETLKLVITCADCASFNSTLDTDMEIDFLRHLIHQFLLNLYLK